MNNLIRAKLKEIVKLQDIVKRDGLSSNQKTEILKFLVNVHYLLLFLSDKYEGHLSVEKADNKQSNLANELNSFEKGTKPFLKSLFEIT